MTALVAVFSVFIPERTRKKMRFLDTSALHELLEDISPLKLTHKLGGFAGSDVVDVVGGDVVGRGDILDGPGN